MKSATLIFLSSLSLALAYPQSLAPTVPVVPMPTNAANGTRAPNATRVHHSHHAPTGTSAPNGTHVANDTRVPNGTYVHHGVPVYPGCAEALANPNSTDALGCLLSMGKPAGFMPWWCIFDFLNFSGKCDPGKNQ